MRLAPQRGHRGASRSRAAPHNESLGLRVARPCRSSSGMKPKGDVGLRARSIVLLVEDDSDVRALYGNALRDAGLCVDEVVTVREALEMSGRLRPHLVILDRDLPDGEGWEVARKLKESEATRDIPIIAFTAHQQRGDVESALVAGCDAFIAKPCAPETLVRHVRSMLGIELAGQAVLRRA